MIGRLVPIAVFLLLGVLLAVGLKIADHKTDLPSPLVGFLCSDRVNRNSSNCVCRKFQSSE